MTWLRFVLGSPAVRPSGDKRLYTDWRTQCVSKLACQPPGLDFESWIDPLTFSIGRAVLNLSRRIRAETESHEFTWADAEGLLRTGQDERVSVKVDGDRPNLRFRREKETRVTDGVAVDIQRRLRPPEFIYVVGILT